MKYFAWLLIGLVMQELVVVMAVAQSPAPVFLTQGWDAETRERFYFTPQGSHLIPYDWFLALERADCPQLLRDNQNMRRLKLRHGSAIREMESRWLAGWICEGQRFVNSSVQSQASVARLRI